MSSRAIEQRRHFLPAGSLYASREGTNVQTVLGSCVAVTVWNRLRRFGGMAHFERAHTPEPSLSSADGAIVELLRAMKEYGSRREELDAQIFGGAGNDKDSRQRGEKNIAIARKLLKRFKIKVISEDVGGSVGRKIVYNTQTNEVLTARVEKIRERDWRLQ